MEFSTPVERPKYRRFRQNLLERPRIMISGQPVRSNSFKHEKTPRVHKREVFLLRSSAGRQTEVTPDLISLSKSIVAARKTASASGANGEVSTS